MTFKVVEAGELCHTIEVLTDGRVLAAKKACLKASGTSIVEPPAQASVSVVKKGPKLRKVGEKAEIFAAIYFHS